MNKKTVDIEKNINSPKHYCNKLGYEAINVLQDWKLHVFRKNQVGEVSPANLSVIGSAFNVVKYLMRAGKKDVVAQEFGKVIYYMKEMKDYFDKLGDGISYVITYKEYSPFAIKEDFELSDDVHDIIYLFVTGKLEDAIKQTEDIYNKSKKKM